MSRVSRRQLLLAAGAMLVAPFAVPAQPSAKLPRLGVLQTGTPADFPHLLDAFREGLRELGHVEGRSIVLEYRWANGRLDALPGLAAELATSKVDAIFAPVTPAALAAKEATSTIPVVFAQVNDPIATKLVSNLSRPGGNVTGVSTNNSELIGKRIELLNQLARRPIARLGILFNPADQSNVLALNETERIARILGMALRPLPVTSPADFSGAFATPSSGKTVALWVAAGGLTNAHARRIVELAAAARVPTIYGSSEFADAGGLMSYSAVFSDSYRRAAAYVVKILNGAKPGDLPVELPTRFELVINRNTAKTLGIRIPQSILARADRVIE